MMGGLLMNPPPRNAYHQTETVFVGERQEFSDAGLCPDDPTIQGRAPRRKPGAKSDAPKRKKPRKRN